MTSVSSLTWLDPSEADRRQALDVIDAFRDRETRDELGLGTIRDGLSEILFPGTTTIQTRARYFLFVPWVYTRLEAARVPSSQIARRARAAEIVLIEPLVGTGEEGVIGRNARADLRRLASAVYWQGLGSWGIRRYSGSQDQYHRSLDAFYARTSDVRRNDDLELVDAPAANWDPSVPPPPPGFPEEATLEIRAEERAYLRDRVVLEHPDTLLAALIRRDAGWDRVPFAWEVPGLGEAPEANRHQLHHARCFSELIHGAQLLYNLLLSEAALSLERIEHYRDRLGHWTAIVEARRAVLTTWATEEMPDFWGLLRHARIAPQTRRFVESYLARLLVIGPAALASDREAREFVRRREVLLKRNLARLVNRTSLSIWGGAAGADQLDVRWGISQRLLLDILPSPAHPDA